MQAVIFDLGSVLINYDHQVTFACISKLAGISVDRLRQLWADIDEPFGRGQMNGRGYYQYLQKHTTLKADYTSFVQEFCCSQERNEAALAFATELAIRPFLKVGIISNTNEIHAAWLRQNVPEFSLFDTVVLSNEVGYLKPEAKIYHLALNQLELPAAQAFFVDDVVQNVQGATAVGIAAIQHTHWDMTEEEVETWLRKNR